MAKIKRKINITTEDESKIRKVWDNERDGWYFSVTDIIAVLTDSVDARNYWKTLKNRLKKTQEQLVSECNQLKLPSADGKKYLVDVANADTLLKIIKTVDPTSLPAFKTYFDHIDVQNNLKKDVIMQQKEVNNQIEQTVSFSTNIELSTTLEAPIDVYETNTEIIINCMVPGTTPESIILSVSMQEINIKGTRNPAKIQDKFLHKELQWGAWQRHITLPTLVDVDNISATEFQGLITIKLQKINPNKNRFIKIKST